MQNTKVYSNIKDYFAQDESSFVRLSKLQRCGLDFFQTITSKERIKYNKDLLLKIRFWLSLVPEEQYETLKSFYRLAKLKASVSIQTRHHYAINYDTLYFAKIINTKVGKEYYLLNIGKIKSIRNIIYLYLSKEKDDEYHRDWIPLIYSLMPFVTEEEELFLLFHFFITEINPGYFRKEENYSSKNTYISAFYTFADRDGIQVVKQTENKTKVFGTSFNIEESFIEETIFSSDKISNMPLYLLIKGISDAWFGSLFAKVLFPEDMLKFLDLIVVFKSRLLLEFGFRLLELFLPRIIAVYKKEKKNMLSELKFGPENLFIAMLPSIIREIFLNNLTTEEYNNIIKQIFLDPNNSKSRETITQDLENYAYSEMRMKTLKLMRAELEYNKLNIYQKMFDFMQFIRETKKENFTMREFIDLFNKVGVKNPKIAAKLFMIADQYFSGNISTHDLIGTMAVLVYGVENKVTLLFEYERKFEDGLTLNEAIEIFNHLETAISIDLIEFKVNMIEAYRLMSENYGEVIISKDDLIDFFTKYQLCQILMIRVSTIDGTNTEVFTELLEEKPEKSIYLNIETAQMPYQSPKILFNSLLSSPDKSKRDFLKTEDRSREFSHFLTGPDCSNSAKIAPKRFEVALGKPNDFDEQVNLMFGSFRLNQDDLKKMVYGH